MLSDLLEQIREYYLTRLVDVINDHGEREGVQVAYEVAFCDDDGEIATEGELDLPCRADLIVVEHGEVADSVQVDTAEMLSFDALDFVWPDTSLNVHLEPFQWNWLQLKIPADTWSREPDWTLLRQWFLDWFQDHDPHDEELLGGVHYLSDPTLVDGAWQLTIDLGSAPINAFEDLLDVVDALGAKSVELGQFSDE